MYMTVQLYAYMSVCPYHAVAFGRRLCFCIEQLSVHVALCMAGLVLEDDGYPSREAVEERMVAYSIPANPENGPHTVRQVSWNTKLVMEWMLNVSANTYLAGAFYFPCTWEGQHGVMLCVSTAAATALSKVNANTSMQIVHNGIPRPEVLAFAAYFYEGMNFGNIRGFSDGVYYVCFHGINLSITWKQRC